MNLVEHGEMELKKVGFNPREITSIESDEDYTDSIANSVLELLKVFAQQGHSGFSGAQTIELFYKLAKWENLGPLTDDPDEWFDLVGAGMVVDDGESARYQNKRNSSCFSYDLKTYYDNDNPEDREYELDENGNKTDWYSMKPKDQRTYKELIHVEHN